MRGLRALASAVLVAAGLLALPGPAAAAPGDQRVVCWGQAPAGWVVTAFTFSPGCGGGLVNAWRITQVEGYPVGTSVATCSGTTPAGWDVVVSGVYMQQCTTNPPFAGYGYVIIRRS